MAFDEHLRRVFDAALAELTEAARADTEQVRTDAHAAGRAEGHAQGREEGHAAGLAAGHVSGVEEGRSAGFEDGHAKGLEEGRSKGFEDGRSQGLEEGRALGWEDGREQGRLEGQQEAKGFDRLLDSIRAIDRARSLTEVLDTAAACAAREAARAAVFLVRDGLLRPWRFIGFDESRDETSDVSMGDAGVVAEAIGGRSMTGSDVVPAFAEPGQPRAIACPLEIAGEVVAVIYADGVASDAPLEALGRHTARALEALTALKAARSLAQPPGSAASTGDDADADASARRYARLLVSEIKLYHEPAVIAGRRDRDLAERLGGEISRARVLYEQRVPDAVRQRSDYFNDELVRTLANGDTTLLHLS